MTDFYEAFLAEMDKVVVMADAPAVAVVGACTRAAKRAQMTIDGAEVSAGPWIVGPEDTGAGPVTCRCGRSAKLVPAPTDTPFAVNTAMDGRPLVAVCTASDRVIQECPYA